MSHQAVVSQKADPGAAAAAATAQPVIHGDYIIWKKEAGKTIWTNVGCNLMYNPSLFMYDSMTAKPMIISPVWAVDMAKSGDNFSDSIEASRSGIISPVTKITAGPDVVLQQDFDENLTNNDLPMTSSSKEIVYVNHNEAEVDISTAAEDEESLMESGLSVLVKNVEKETKDDKIIPIITVFTPSGSQPTVSLLHNGVLIPNENLKTQAPASPPPIFRCPEPECHRTFTTRHSLIAHQPIHQKSTYPCLVPGCNKVFTTPTILKRHSLVHKKVRDWKCTLCGKAFKEKYSLKMHFNSARHQKKLKDAKVKEEEEDTAEVQPEQNDEGDDEEIIFISTT